MTKFAESALIKVKPEDIIGSTGVNLELRKEPVYNRRGATMVQAVW
jgi:hypothetical protein